MASLVRFGVSLPADLIKAFDDSIERKGYRARSEAVRDLMRRHLVEEQWESDAEVIGTVTIVYDHGPRDLATVLTELQHQFCDAVICTTHVHVDEHNCLEVVVLRGTSQDVREIADRLISTKGVKHGRLVSTTTGAGLS
jgi:CopG family transcriptional regulator, nickel-responsive regulator